MTERRETAGLTMRLVVEFVRRNHGDAALAHVLELAGETRPLSVLEDEAVWSSYDQKIALFAAAAEVTGRPDIARAIGETVLQSSVGTTLKVALGMLGSASSLLRLVARASAKFSTAGDMRAEHVTSTSGVVHYRVRDGFTLSPHDCGYALGLLTQVPVLFGLPPAVIDHDQCQVRGATECIYRMHWSRRSRLPWRRREGLASEALLARLHQLQATLGDLVATRDVDDVLDTIAARAGSAVSAERFVLAAQLDENAPLRVRYEGFDKARAHQVAATLINGDDALGEGNALVVEVRSASRSYGRLAAFATYPFLAQERELLEAYARLAATALDAVTALAVAEDGRRTAEALLGLARQLHGTHTREQIAFVVAEAAQTVVDADVATILLFEGGTDELSVVGHAGWSADLEPLLQKVRVRREDTPELDYGFAHPDEPRLFDDTCADPFLRGLLQEFRTRLIAVVPINGSDRLHGVVIAGWAVNSPLPTVSESLLQKLAGLADQATTALEKANLVEQVHAQATTDALTGVANRRLLAERVRHAVEAASPDTPPALLFIDLDRFKVVNDTLGHSAGDHLLQVVAQRLHECVRTDDLVARLGGDEFTILLHSVVNTDAALELAQRVVKALAEPVLVEGRMLRVRCSVGVVVIPPGSHTASEILRDADAAMYAAKKAGGDRCVLFDPELFGSDRDALDLEADLYAAVDTRALQVAYQPQVDLVTGQVIGVECLARWQHPTRGNVPPDRFLPVAEATGLIVPLDLCVLDTACRQGARWHEMGLSLRLAVNVSARTLTDERFVPAVVETLSVSGLPPTALEVELTEATAIADVDKVRSVLSALRTHGVSVAIDDLGTGYSSLLWVSSFPIDRIKIDRSFVADLDGGGPGAPLVEALAAIAGRLGHGVIAEGVETQTQVDQLLAIGCTEAQGYLLGRPGPADDVTRKALAPQPQVASTP